MSEFGSDWPVIITARQRVHPAVRKLARACIALARQLVVRPVAPAGGKAPVVGERSDG